MNKHSNTFAPFVSFGFCLGLAAQVVLVAVCLNMGCSTIDPPIPGQTAAAPFLEFTNGSAYLLGHSVSSNEIYTASLAATQVGVNLLVRDSPGATNYLPAAQAVFQSVATGGTFNSTNLANALAVIQLKNASDQTLLNGLISTALSLTGVYVHPLVSSDTNSYQYVEAALLGIGNGL
jgi:hypothetical protein